MGSKKIGILGGGQLARILALKADELGLKAAVLSPSSEDPAAQAADLWQKGDPRKISDLKKFVKTVDILTFESELIPAWQVKKALEKNRLKEARLKKDRRCRDLPHIAPSLEVISLLQDRLFQKQLLQKFQFGAAAFEPVSFDPAEAPANKKSSKRQKIKRLRRDQSVQSKLASVWDRLGPFVLKTRTGGYDGYGTFVVKSKSQAGEIKTFARLFIAEKWIPFKRELAILAARNSKGQIVFFPLVETKQEQARCLWVRGPVSHKKLSALKRKIKIFLEAIRYEGVIAFELFDTGRELLVNELAPRVHNSGHYSLDGLTEDQFTIHLKAIANFSLKKPRSLNKAFAMLNLLGEGHAKPKLSEGKGLKVWWYGKKESRLGRKMGHLNSLGASPSQALGKLLKARPRFKV